jgi:acyl-CoA thioesterase-1
MSRARWISVLAASLCAWAPAAGARAADPPVIVALGDSLTAGLGVAPDEAYPARLQGRLTREGYRYRIINAGVSGDTTAGGLRRLDWVLRAGPDIVIVALGANDGLRGQSVLAMRRNLEQIVERCQVRGARVLLAGMRLPPNYGDAYTRSFARAFAQVAARAGVAFMPFLLDGVAAIPHLNQPDGIHPNARGHALIAERLWLYLRPLLARARNDAPSASLAPSGSSSSPGVPGQDGRSPTASGTSVRPPLPSIARTPKRVFRGAC